MCLCVCWCVCWSTPKKREKNRVYVQNASVCTFKTSPCMPAPRAHVFQHVRVVPTRGKDQGENAWLTRSVQCQSFNVPSRSSAAEPLG